MGARLVANAKLALVAVVALRLEPRPLLWSEHRVQWCLGVWLVANVLESQLLSSGAFEVFCGDRLLFSKLKTSRAPNAYELLSLIRRACVT